MFYVLFSPTTRYIKNEKDYSMGASEDRTREFIIELIRSGGWDLRYSPQGLPYAALLQGFGNNEAGVRLHFIPRGGSIKVVGVIDYSDKIGARRPYVYVSIYKGVDEALRIIKGRLLPKYKSAWHNTQPEIMKWLENHPNP